MVEDPTAGATVLTVIPCGEDLTSLRDMLTLNRSAWNLRFAQTFREASVVLGEAETGVVISECCLPDGGWKDLLDEIQNLTKPPLLIVASRLADNRLWAEVLNLGGFDLLVEPFDAAEVLRVVSAAWRAWKYVEPPRPPPKAAAGRSLKSAGSAA